MRTSRWLREHGWVVPTTYVLLAIGFGLVLPRMDRANPGLHFLGALAAEQLLAAIASGMIAFTGIVFSISLIVSQFWSTAYSMRLMQWLRRTPITGHAFGTFSVVYPAPTWDDLRNLFENLELAVPPERREAVEDRLRRLDAACERELPVGDRDDARIPDPQGLGHSRAA